MIAEELVQAVNKALYKKIERGKGKLEKLIQDEFPQIQLEKINSIRYFKKKPCRP